MDKNKLLHAHNRIHHVHSPSSLPYVPVLISLASLMQHQHLSVYGGYGIIFLFSKFDNQELFWKVCFIKHATWTPPEEP